MKKELVFLVDRSLSAYREKEKILTFCSRHIKEYDASLVSLCFFSDDAEMICLRQPPEIAEKALKKAYFNDGSTAVYDAVGRMITEWDKYAEMTNADAVSVCLYIITDGMDTASMRLGFSEAEKLLHQKEAAGWHIELFDTQLKKRKLSILDKKGRKNGNKSEIPSAGYGA